MSVALMVFLSNTLCIASEDIVVNIESYGRYKADIEKIVNNDNASGGVKVISSNIVNIETTKNIPCRIGERFGFTAKYLNLPADRKVTIKKIVTHPPIKQSNGTILEKSFSEIIVSNAKPIRYTGWLFREGHEYELVPGVWTIKLYSDDKEIASVEFIVK
jgi:hypothetical protein